jgi:hypothetical protein
MWIQTAISHKGAATAAAKRAGMSVHEWCLKHEHSPGVTGKRARLGLTLEGLHQHDASQTPEAIIDRHIAKAKGRM